MDVNLSIPLLLAVLVSMNSISPLTLKTEDVIFQYNDNIILNCSYERDSTDAILIGNIRWQKQMGDHFNDLALFSTFGSHRPFIAKDMQPLYSNRTELIDPNNSHSAVLIIKEAVCTDQGIYRCWIEYFFYVLSKLPVSHSIVTFTAISKEPETFIVFPKELEENKSITLMCSADVGSPRGNVKIWKISQYNDTPELIYQSDAPKNETENCTDVINAITTYTVTRDDNEAKFLCSSQNNLTRGPGPSRESSKISVIYGPDIPTVTLNPSKSVYFVGNWLIIQCSTDSNPPPLFTWSFWPHNTSEDMIVGLFHGNSKLLFDSLQTTDSGRYICTTANAARPNSPNSSSVVSIYVKQSEIDYDNQGCSQCGYLRVCQLKNGKNVCVINTWVPISIVFIFTCASFAVATTILINDKRKWPKPAIYSNVSHSQSALKDGGYQTHFDVTNTHIYSALQSIQSEGGEYASIENVSQLQESSIRQFK